MTDINFRIRGDGSEAQAAFRGVGAASAEMSGDVADSADSFEQQAEAAEQATESQKGLTVTMRDVVKLAKDVVKFVGDSVAEYLKSADAQKELVQVARDFDAAQKGLKKSVGEATLEIAKQLQLAEAAQGALSFLQTLFRGDSDENLGREKRMNELLEAQAQLRAARINGAAAEIEAASKRVVAAQRAMGIAAGQSITPDFVAGAGAQKSAEEQAKKAYEISQKAAADRLELAKRNAEDLRKLMKEEDESDLIALQRGTEARKKEEEARLKFAREADKAFIAEQDDFAAQLEGSWKTAADALEKARDEALKQQEEASKKLAAQQAEDARRWQQAGDAIGAAFVNALADQLSKLSEGEEFDVGEFIVSIISAAVSVAATAIGSAYGQPALGAAIGNIASLGIKAGYNAISAKSKKPMKTFHDGGWVGEDGLPRYHSGAWIGQDEELAVLQRGERVLSRDEVSTMGGKASVETAARGGSPRSLSLNVSTIDAKGFTRLFTSEGDRGIRDALRTGQGLLPSLLGRSPR